MTHTGSLHDPHVDFYKLILIKCQRNIKTNPRASTKKYTEQNLTYFSIDYMSTVTILAFQQNSKCHKK